MIVQRFLERARYLAIIAVFGSLVSALVGFLIGTQKAVALAVRALRGLEENPSLRLVQTMDSFLIGAALLLFALATYELFIDSLKLPDWLRVESLDDLKGKLAGIVVLVMAVEFLEQLTTETDMTALLKRAIAIALVAGVLTVFGRTSVAHKS
jgi:uncharacterized membrane protein YqhA